MNFLGDRSWLAGDQYNELSEAGSLLGEQQFSIQCQNTCWPVPRGK